LIARGPKRAGRVTRAVVLACAMTIVLAAGQVLGQAGQVQAGQPNEGVNASVEFRGSGGVVEAPVEVLSAGLLVRPRDAAGGQTTQVVAWHRVRDVRGDGLSVGAWGEVGQELMRAVARIERGDGALAGDVAEPLYARLLGAGELRGPTGLVLCEVVTRVRLERQGPGGATLAWLRWLQVAAEHAPSVGGAGGGGGGGASQATSWTKAQWVGQRTTLTPVVDERTGLCPQLPPVFGRGLTGPALVAMLASAEWPATDEKSIMSAGAGGAAGDPRRDALVIALAYRVAAQFESGGEAALGAAGASGVGVVKLAEQKQGEAAGLVLDIVAARVGDAGVRVEARKRLSERLASLRRDETTSEIEPDDAPIDRTWQRAWVHLGLGRSLLRETEADQRRRGLVELLHVPALFQVEHPSLAALALLEARSEAGGMNLGAGAIEAIERELREGLGLGEGLSEPPPASGGG